MANPKKCSGCWKPTFQVRVSGLDLRGKTARQVYEETKNIITTDLKHVVKKTEQDSAFLHFKSHLIASIFYNSKVSSSFVLGGAIVTVHPPSLKNGGIVQYSQHDLSSALSSNQPAHIDPSEPQPQPSEREPQPQPQPSEREPQPQPYEPEPRPMAWRMNVKQAILKLKTKEKWHEEELTNVRKKRKLLEEALN